MRFVLNDPAKADVKANPVVNGIDLTQVVAGDVVALEDVQDEVFSKKLMVQLFLSTLVLIQYRDVPEDIICYERGLDNKHLIVIGNLAEDEIDQYFLKENIAWQSQVFVGFFLK